LRFPKKRKEKEKNKEKKKKEKKKKKKKKNQKKGIVVPFVSSRAAHFVSSGVLCFPFVSRLASLARSRLGPAQYHR
jgi:hypothetical protein